jgi:ABC-type phosphate transport system substrate-binding protein
MNRFCLTLTPWCGAAAAVLALTMLPAQAQTPPAAGATTQPQDRGSVVMIAHPSVAAIDTPTAQRLFSGRAVEVAGVLVVPINAAPGSKARDRFMTQVMAMDDDKYVAYWTVRKHIGKGTPPREARSAAEMIEFVQATPGALGYVSTADLRPGLNIVLRP